MKLLTVATGTITIAATYSLVSAAPYGINWSAQFGTAANDWAMSVATSSAGDYFVAGGTYGSLDGHNQGFDDSFLIRFSSSGQIGWSVQAGTSQQERYRSVAVVGETIYFLTGMETRAASGMPGLYQYDTTGELLSTRINSFPDYGTFVDTFDLTSDSEGNVYVGGTLRPNHIPENAFVAKINPHGETQWHRLTNTIPGFLERTQVVADSEGNIYVAGDHASVNGTDIYLQKYDSAGNRLWSRSYGSVLAELVHDLDLDLLGNPVIAGETAGDFGGAASGGLDPFVLKTDPQGDVLWVNQFGGGATESATCIDVAPNGSIFVAGVDWVVPGEINSQNAVALWGELDPSGNLKWLDRISGPSVAHDVIVNSRGDVIIVGQTSGAVFGPRLGGLDAFFVEFDVNAIPEPTGFWLLFAGAFCMMTARIWRRGDV